MKDKYCLSREENIFVAKKRWVQSIYSGMRMENRNVTFPQTQTILDGINVPDVGIDDIQAILNMRDAWNYTLSHIEDKLDVAYLCAVQKRVAYREALVWGELRTGSVGISGVKYLPPIPNEKKANSELANLIEEPLSKTEIALNVFAWAARAQLFWDGNKRTALLAANKILIEHGAGILLVPDDLVVKFSSLLSDYYETGIALELKNFLYQTSIVGIDSLSSINTNMPMIAKEEAAGKEPAKTSAWLKDMRKKMGITQRELAKATGIAVSTIANIEQGQRKGSNDVWSKIEHYFGC